MFLFIRYLTQNDAVSLISWTTILEHISHDLISEANVVNMVQFALEYEDLTVEQ